MARESLSGTSVVADLGQALGQRDLEESPHIEGKEDDDYRQEGDEAGLLELDAPAHGRAGPRREDRRQGQRPERHEDAGTGGQSAGHEVGASLMGGLHQAEDLQRQHRQHAGHGVEDEPAEDRQQQDQREAASAETVAACRSCAGASRVAGRAEDPSVLRLAAGADAQVDVGLDGGGRRARLVVTSLVGQFGGQRQLARRVVGNQQVDKDVKRAVVDRHRLGREAERLELVLRIADLGRRDIVRSCHHQFRWDEVVGEWSVTVDVPARLHHHLRRHPRHRARRVLALVGEETHLRLLEVELCRCGGRHGEDQQDEAGEPSDLQGRAGDGAAAGQKGRRGSHDSRESIGMPEAPAEPGDEL